MSLSMFGQAAAFPTMAAMPTLTARQAVPSTTIVVKVGSTKFSAGDADFFGFKPLWQRVCDGAGCDQGTEPQFAYNKFSVGPQQDFGGSFTMSGEAFNDAATTNALLDAIEHAMLLSQQCTLTRGKKCNVKRDSGPVANNCASKELFDCTYANFIQATLFRSDATQQAQVQMLGKADEEAALDCDTVFGIANGAVAAFDPTPVVEGALAFGEIVCGILKG